MRPEVVMSQRQKLVRISQKFQPKIHRHDDICVMMTSYHIEFSIRDDVRTSCEIWLKRTFKYNNLVINDSNYYYMKVYSDYEHASD